MSGCCSTSLGHKVDVFDEINVVDEVGDVWEKDRPEVAAMFWGLILEKVFVKKRNSQDEMVMDFEVSALQNNHKSICLEKPSTSVVQTNWSGSGKRAWER